jgi:spermidine/putrescine transport system permease protein
MFIVVLGFLLILTFFPIAILLLLSLNETSTLPLRNFPTLKWYIELLRFPAAINAVKYSLMVASVTTGAAVIFGICGGYALARTNFAGKKIFTGLLLMPMVTPYIIMGFSLMSFLLKMGVNPSLIVIIIGHILITIPYTTLVLTSRFIALDISLEEAAMDLGAGKFTTFRKVTLPLIMPGVAVAAILAFIISWEDVALAVFLAGTEQTAPVYIYSLLMKLPKFVPILTAMSSIILSFAIGLAFLMRMIERISA